jgi:putative membrane protein
MNRWAGIGLVAGLALFVALLLHVGAGDVAEALVQGGWALPAVVAVHLLPLAIDAEAWRLLFEARLRPGFARACRLRWISEAVNNLLPVAQLGGEFARARLAAQGELGLARTGAAATADVTIGAITQIPFALVGLVGLAAVAADDRSALLWALLGGLVLFLALILAFLRVQRAGLGRIVMALIHRVAPGAAGLGDPWALDREIHAIYMRRRALVAAAAWRLVGWVVGAAEIWVALALLGAPITWQEAIVVEAILQLARSVAFVIPAALGVQEGSLILMAAAFGLPGEMGLALSLIRRGRDLVLGVPGLMVWQFWEVARLRRAR